MALFARLDDTDELLEEAHADVEDAVDVLRASMHALDAGLSGEKVDEVLGVCAPLAASHTLSHAHSHTRPRTSLRLHRPGNDALNPRARLRVDRRGELPQVPTLPARV